MQLISGSAKAAPARIVCHFGIVCSFGRYMTEKTLMDAVDQEA
jgi:hypothetical protein